MYLTAQRKPRFPGIELMDIQTTKGQWLWIAPEIIFRFGMQDYGDLVQYRVDLVQSGGKLSVKRDQDASSVRPNAIQGHDQHQLTDAIWETADIPSRGWKIVLRSEKRSEDWNASLIWCGVERVEGFFCFKLRSKQIRKRTIWCFHKMEVGFCKCATDNQSFA